METQLCPAALMTASLSQRSIARDRKSNVVGFDVEEDYWQIVVKCKVFFNVRQCVVNAVITRQITVQLHCVTKN